MATLIQAERELAVIVEALSCLPDLAAMTRKTENRKQKADGWRATAPAEARKHGDESRGSASGGTTAPDDDGDDDEVDDPRLLPYVVNARSVVDSVICIAAWRLKQLEGRLRRLRGSGLGVSD